MRSGVLMAVGASLLALLAAQPTLLAAQELPVLHLSDPGPRPACPAGEQRREAVPDERARNEARELARSATEAALLGDPEEARDLLRRATEKDSRSPELAYRRARAHDELEEADPAVRWYCRYLALDPSGEDASRVRDRLSALHGGERPAVDGIALRAFREGVDRLKRKRLGDAERRFTYALRAEPGLAEARYNRGLALGAAGRSEDAVRDLRAYLDERPDAPDRERVEDAIAYLKDPPAPHDPTAAFLLGAAVPGAGHFYTGRPVLGGLLLGAAGAGVAAAFYEKIRIECLIEPRDGVCPGNQIHKRTVDHPGLVPGLAVAVAAAAVSAVTAHASAVSGNQETARLGIAAGDEEAKTRRGLRVLPPSVAPSGTGVALRLVRLRF